MLEFLNQNQGAVSAASAAATALLTLVYVAATVWLVRVSQRQAALAQKSIEVLGEAERNRYRPYLVFDIKYDGVIAQATLKNIGLSPALAVKVAIAPDLKWPSDSEGVGFIDHGVALLAPGREIEEPCGAGIEFRKAYPDLKFQGVVCYADRERTYEEPFTIDLKYASHMKSFSEPDAPRELQKIAEALVTIASTDFHPLVRILEEKDYPKYREEFTHRRSVATYERLKAMAQANSSASPSEQSRGKNSDGRD